MTLEDILSYQEKLKQAFPELEDRLISSLVEHILADTYTNIISSGSRLKHDIEILRYLATKRDIKSDIKQLRRVVAMARMEIRDITNGSHYTSVVCMHPKLYYMLLDQPKNAELQVTIFGVKARPCPILEETEILICNESKFGQVDINLAVSKHYVDSI